MARAPHQPARAGGAPFCCRGATAPLIVTMADAAASRKVADAPPLRLHAAKPVARHGDLADGALELLLHLADAALHEQV